MTPSRLPYIPTKSDWLECVELLCEHCAHWPRCEIVEGMIEAAHGGGWPAGGWVTDPGAEVTCLSYQPATRAPLSRPVLKRALKSACEMCAGCAAQKGSEASVALHTQRDFRASVANKTRFDCHDPANAGKPCGGWAAAIKHKTTTAQADRG